MVYVAIPGNAVTGGPETLHQIADMISRKGVEVRVVYLNPEAKTIPEKYTKYNIKLADRIEDNKNNFIIFPETMGYLVKRYKNIHKCIMWLSVDFYKDSTPHRTVIKRLKIRHLPIAAYPFVFIHKFCAGQLHFSKYQFDDDGRILHGYNCEYAHQYVLRHGIKEDNTIYICGPIDDKYIECYTKLDFSNKKDIILYNPKKGMEFSQSIIRRANERNLPAKFIPIINMSTDEILEKMIESKIYMDFGEFPGPERIPREAVSCGCNLITSLNGSATLHEDIPIPDQFKFEAKNEMIDVVISKLSEMLVKYKEQVSCFDEYREKVRQQPIVFEKNIGMLVDYIKNRCSE